MVRWAVSGRIARRRIARRVPSRRRRCVGFVDQRRALCTIVAGDGVAILCLVTVSEQTACDRDDVAFIFVAANARRFDAALRSERASSADAASSEAAP